MRQVISHTRAQENSLSGDWWWLRCDKWSPWDRWGHVTSQRP